ncbi:MAG TPA: cupredoxin domain-containing protein [Nitrospirota bacterium]|nr:cupredoxin domain-containing protein [Nitrospirota bacterium]
MTSINYALRHTLIMITVFTLSLSAAGLFAGDQPDQVIKITAKKFEYSPNEIKIKKGVPVVLEFTSLDRIHGFTVPDLGGVRATIEPGKATRVTIIAPKAGTYEFHCDIFCGDGHEGMTGKIIVED